MRRDSLVLASVEFVDVLALGVILPLLPSLVARFGLGVAGGLALALVPVVAALVAAAWLGPLSGRWGRKAVLVATCLVTAEALFVFAWAGDVFMLFMARLMTGIAAGNIAVVAATRRDLVQDGAAGDQRNERLAALGLGLLAGIVLGLLLGGSRASAAGYLGGALAVVSLVGVLAMVHETLPLTSAGRVAVDRGLRLHGEATRAGRSSDPPSRRR